ncbi:hypothetical protein M6I34_08215 [Burkholderiaceae bacterium FT117]|uniref:hypothetical protein n=1 Tax=Zeimonas sediminis TaxID=2944268 RepID=UPI002342BE08|nr:hypothetical protein [Zeimonas sediminis]MCM5570490.1 hypothetical protein [Zeimonas sediminis]
MKVETAWVSPPQAIGGLDHLGTQAPCILVYGQLLPGITNVTDRARYYSFYPWLIWSFDQRYAKDDEARFVEFFRRADCLFTLISERHARKTDGINERHGVAMVGRNQLTPALDRLEKGEPMVLSKYTSQESPQRYFKNPLGGLSQYYAGTLSELQLMDASTKPWIKYTKELGAPLAQQVESHINANRFWQVVESDSVTAEDLDSLSDLCACQLPRSADERNTLVDLFFDRTNSHAQEGLQRRRSLGLILHLARSLPKDHDLTESVFRACTYSGALPGRTPWTVPEALRHTLACWTVYQRNDLLSVACQTIFGLSLRELDTQDAAQRIAHGSIESFAEAFSKSMPVSAVARSLNANLMGDFLDQLTKSMPPVDFWEHEEHEVQVALRMLAAWPQGDDLQGMLRRAVTVLALLACRDDASLPPYGDVAMPPEALADYPINLASFRARVAAWRPMNFSAFIADLVTWCLSTHLRVALRKLRHSGRSTFHLRPSERGLEVVGEIPPPAATTPRFRQAVQILRDIGALTRDASPPSRQTRPSSLGISLMAESSV